MDFLDPIQQRKHILMVYVGYVLIAIAVLLATAILVLFAYGFSISKDGQVVQNGLVFVSSTPSGANLYIDGKLEDQTNTRLNLPAGSYHLEIRRDGYRTWERQITVAGSDLVRYDYPFLFPSTLTTSSLAHYSGQPELLTQSLDSRWLLVMRPTIPGTFDQFDLKNPKQAPTKLTIPALDYTAAKQQRWQVVSWADDDTHVLLKHTYGSAGVSEFVLLDRKDPTQTVNLNKLFDAQPSQVQLINNKYDKYYLYDAAADTLRTASLSAPTPVEYQTNVLAYVPLSDDHMLFLTPDHSDSKQVAVELRHGDQVDTIRHWPAGGSHPLAIASYKGDLYVASGSTDQGVAYIYKDPLAKITVTGDLPAYRTLRLKGLDRLSFSAGGRLVAAENNTSFAVYDVQYKDTYTYALSQPMDKGQGHATWMDGAHLQYVTKGRLLVFDFDGSNAQLLMDAQNDANVFYDPGFKHLVTPATAADGTVSLTTTPLRVPADM